MELKSSCDIQAETDAFKCGKCGQHKTRYYQMQTRSADEPMTVSTGVFSSSRKKLCMLTTDCLFDAPQTFVTCTVSPRRAVGGRHADTRALIFVELQQSLEIFVSLFAFPSDTAVTSPVLYGRDNRENGRFATAKEGGKSDIYMHSFLLGNPFFAPDSRGLRALCVCRDPRDLASENLSKGAARSPPPPLTCHSRKAP